jgi:DNA-binding transcriptional regulator PaaX
MGSFPPRVIHKVRAALKYYRWEKSHVMLKFAQHVGHSEFAIRTALYQLIDLGEVEQIQEGYTPKNYPRIIYRLKTPCTH